MTTAIITNGNGVPEFSKFMSAMIAGGWVITVGVKEPDWDGNWKITGVPAWSAAHPNAIVMTNPLTDNRVRIDLSEITTVEVVF